MKIEIVVALEVLDPVADPDAVAKARERVAGLLADDNGWAGWDLLSVDVWPHSLPVMGERSNFQGLAVPVQSMEWLLSKTARTVLGSIIPDWPLPHQEPDTESSTTTKQARSNKKK